MSWDLAVTLSVFALAAVAWDIGRRWVDAMCFNQVVLDRLSDLEREREKHKEQMQAVLSKLNATQAVATRLRSLDRSTR